MPHEHRKLYFKFWLWEKGNEIRGYKNLLVLLSKMLCNSVEQHNKNTINYLNTYEVYLIQDNQQIQAIRFLQKYNFFGTITCVPV